MSEKLGDRDVVSLELTLNSLIGKSEYPLSIIGDLLDLRDTFERGSELLSALIAGRATQSDLPATLREIELLLTERFPAISVDLIPELHAVRDRLP